MKNAEYWDESKYTYSDGRLVASSNIQEVSGSSRLVANLVAAEYDKNIRKYVRGRLLDLGCGQVPLFSSYRDFIDENICVDWSNSIHPNIYLDFEVDLTQRLPIQEGEFDTIIFSDVLRGGPRNLNSAVSGFPA